MRSNPSVLSTGVRSNPSVLSTGVRSNPSVLSTGVRSNSNRLLSTFLALYNLSSSSPSIAFFHGLDLSASDYIDRPPVSIPIYPHHPASYSSASKTFPSHQALSYLNILLLYSSILLQTCYFCVCVTVTLGHCQWLQTRSS